jgi:hypothetical protein
MRTRVLPIGSFFAGAILLAGALHIAPAAAQSDGTSFPVDAFSQLQIEGGGHAIIAIGSPASVTVSGPEAEVANLQVQVWFNTLEIEPNDDDNRNASSDLVYHITVPSLSQIELEGSVTAEVDGLASDSLEISVEDSSGLHATNLSIQRLEAQVEGSSTVTLSGTTGSQQIESEDSATYDALQLDSQSAEIEAEGSSHSKVRVTDSLTGQIEDSAVVEYMTESGSVSVSNEGSATLTQLPFEALGA